MAVSKIFARAIRVTATVAMTMAVTVMLSSCGEPEPVVLSDEEMEAAFAQRTEALYDAILPVYGDVLREFDNGDYGTGDKLSTGEPTQMNNPERFDQMCDDMVAAYRSFDETLKGVERDERFIAYDEAYDGMPDVSSVAGMLVAMESAGFMTIDDYPLNSEYSLEDRFPESPDFYWKNALITDGQLNGWPADEIMHIMLISFDTAVSDCFFDGLRTE